LEYTKPQNPVSYAHDVKTRTPTSPPPGPKRSEKYRTRRSLMDCSSGGIKQDEIMKSRGKNTRLEQLQERGGNKLHWEISMPELLFMSKII